MENEVMSIDDVLGDAIPYDQQDAMRQFCLFSLKMPTVGSITQSVFLLIRKSFIIFFSLLFGEKVNCF